MPFYAYVVLIYNITREETHNKNVFLYKLEINKHKKGYECHENVFYMFCSAINN